MKEHVRFGQLEVKAAVGGEFGALPDGMKSRWLFTDDELVTFPLVVFAYRPSRTCCGVAFGLSSRYSAAAPAVCGEAIDVPLMVFVASSPVFHALVMFTPGANQSTQFPKFEKYILESLLAVAPMVIAAGVRAGE